VAREHVVSENPYVRSAALRTLEKVGPAAADAVGVLVPLLAGPNQFVQDHAARVLAAIGPAAVPALVEALRDERTSEHASWALRWMGPPAAAAVPAVIEILRDPASPVFRHALHVLWMGPAARAAVPTLIETLRHTDPEIRRSAVSMLQEIEEDTAAVRAALRERLGDEDRYVREYAAEALAALAGPAPEVLELLGAGQVGVRLAVVEGLGEWVGRSAAVADALRAAARDPNKKVAAAAAAALKRVTPP
jgi:HEAT repeat protein